jgi:hypothetical protein
VATALSHVPALVLLRLEKPIRGDGPVGGPGDGPACSLGQVCGLATGLVVVIVVGLVTDAAGAAVFKPGW